MFIIWLLLIGLVAGFLARAIVPGRDPMGIGGTIVLGVIGSFVGGFLADVFLRDDAADKGIGSTAGIIGSVIGAVVALLIWNAFNRRRGVHA